MLCSFEDGLAITNSHSDPTLKDNVIQVKIVTSGMMIIERAGPVLSEGIPFTDSFKVSCM